MSIAGRRWNPSVACGEVQWRCEIAAGPQAACARGEAMREALRTRRSGSISRSNRTRRFACSTSEGDCRDAVRTTDPPAVKAEAERLRGCEVEDRVKDRLESAAGERPKSLFVRKMAP